MSGSCLVNPLFGRLGVSGPTLRRPSSAQNPFARWNFGCKLAHAPNEIFLIRRASQIDLTVYADPALDHVSVRVDQTWDHDCAVDIQDAHARTLRKPSTRADVGDYAVAHRKSVRSQNVSVRPNLSVGHDQTWVASCTEKHEESCDDASILARRSAGYESSASSRHDREPMPRVRNGLDALMQSDFTQIRGKRVGLLCNQASVNSDYEHILDVVTGHPNFELHAIFGPQHGLFGHTQDNMIEWEGADQSRFGAPIFSLYGENREPSAEMLAGIDLFLVDLQDVGARYYTFVWTMCLCIRACSKVGIPVLVLDRPNPITGAQTEGFLLEPDFSTFVGLRPILTRHGMTIGELAKYEAAQIDGAVVNVVTCVNWDPQGYLDEQGGTWAMPSPNMPTIDTAVVYPGACLLEATNLSEGRGTTRPFETVGAPWLDGWRLAADLNRENMPGCAFRPLEFQPTHNKYVGQVCQGVFVHVTDRREFEPVLTYARVMQACALQRGIQDSSPIGPQASFVPNSPETRLLGFAWRQPPYEYETARLPIDILAGTKWLRQAIERDAPATEYRGMFAEARAAFEPIRSEFSLYDR